MPRTHEDDVAGSGAAPRRSSSPNGCRTAARRSSPSRRRPARAGRRRPRAAVSAATGPRALRRPRRTRRDPDARVSARPGQGYGSPVIDTPPRPAPPAPPAIERPAAYQVSYGVVEGRAAPGARTGGRADRREGGPRAASLAARVPARRRPPRPRGQGPGRDGRSRAAAVRGGQWRTSSACRARRGRASGRRASMPGSRRTSAGWRPAFRGRRRSTSRTSTTGAAAAWNARATFPAASTLKLAIAVTALSRVDGPPRPGTSLDSLLRQMLDASDNEAANRLLVSLGGSTSGGGQLVDAAMRSIGLERTVMYGGYILGTSLGPARAIASRELPLDVVEQPAWGVGKATTAVDLARLHRAIWLASGGLGPLGRGAGGISPAEARHLLYLLAHVADGGKLGRLLGGRPGVVVLHKAGWIDAARHDAGLVVWRGGVFVATVMTYDGAGAGTRSDVLAGRVAQAALRQLQRLTANPVRRKRCQTPLCVNPRSCRRRSDRSNSPEGQCPCGIGRRRPERRLELGASCPKVRAPRTCLRPVDEVARSGCRSSLDANRCLTPIDHPGDAARREGAGRRPRCGSACALGVRCRPVRCRSLGGGSGSRTCLPRIRAAACEGFVRDRYGGVRICGVARYVVGIFLYLLRRGA